MNEGGKKRKESKTDSRCGGWKRYSLKVPIAGVCFLSLQTSGKSKTGMLGERWGNWRRGELWKGGRILPVPAGVTRRSEEEWGREKVEKASEYDMRRWQWKHGRKCVGNRVRMRRKYWLIDLYREVWPSVSWVAILPMMLFLKGCLTFTGFHSQGFFTGHCIWI